MDVDNRTIDELIISKKRDRVQGHMYDNMATCGLRDIIIEKEDYEQSFIEWILRELQHD